MHHWLLYKTCRDGISLSFERFKLENEERIAVWSAAYPALADYPPIYWSNDQWRWHSPDPESIDVYETMCHALVHHAAITTKS